MFGDIRVGEGGYRSKTSTFSIKQLFLIRILDFCPLGSGLDTRILFTVQTSDLFIQDSKGSFQMTFDTLRVARRLSRRRGVSGGGSSPCVLHKVLKQKIKNQVSLETGEKSPIVRPSS